ncbi:3-dehydroshikimate dehydratase [Neorhizobium huautlense]|uniref:3-dehydroshikimate dehydratase n=1 Tax=Neorhizobium huautlense TaxID=67774 RepID=A0ABT9PRQ8_9HYPH|nr:sugar phosphate isomerase/epimerase [Neorhizobium huautlense]MDP9836554.1 3-dehydroshikimate dehydratase [Neorhizobium huautlense]
MNISLCTITFRHQLISLAEIANFARESGFDGIELWGAHARNLAPQMDKDADWLADYGLAVPMISDYLPLEGDDDVLRRKTVELCRLGRRWKAKKIRTFAGGKASADTTADERRHLVTRLREVAKIVESYGIDLLVETHPNTLADTAASTIRLIDEVDHPALAINFDILHVWEAGDDPVALHRAIGRHVRHYHLKNISDRRHLHVFSPGNVYSAAGDRNGMTPLLEGAVDYADVIVGIPALAEADISLEWFGNDVFHVLRRDCETLRAQFGFEKAYQFIPKARILQAAP